MAFPVDERWIEEAESQLGRSLPAWLRQRLRSDNGGDLLIDGTEWSLYPVWDPSDRKRMARTSSHVVHETSEAREWRSFPEGAVAIAGNGFGDHIILRPGSDKVELWDHETGEVVAVSSDLI